MSVVSELSPTVLRARLAAQRLRAPESRVDEQTRWLASRILAIVALAVLVSVLPTPLRHVMQGVFGGQSAIGPIARSTAVIFWVAGLLLTARGLRHGHWIAWILTLSSVGAAVTVHLVRHDDYAETALLAVGAVFLVARSRSFGVHTSRATAARTVSATVSVLALGAALVGLSATDVLPRFHPLAGPLGFGSGVVSTAVFVSVLAVLMVIFWLVLSPRAADPVSDEEHHRQRDRARAVVAAHGGGTLDYFALRDDKRWFFHADSVVAYAVRFGVCLVSPDPIGPIAERRAVWTAFMEHVRRHGWSISVMGASQEWIDLYASFGLHPLYLGDEAVVNCSTFTLEGHAMKGLRQACNRVDRAGFTVTFHDPTLLSAADRHDLLNLAASGRTGTVERGFSMTLSRLFDREDTGLLLSVTRDREGRARAFIQWAPAPGICGWSLDVMRYDTSDDVPNGVMEHLIVQTIREVASRGQVGLGLNFAVLRTVVNAEADTRLKRLRQRALEAVSGRTEVNSLYRFNQKFSPDWRPRYVVLSSVDTVLCQGLMISAAEGLSDLPVIGRFMQGVGR